MPAVPRALVPVDLSPPARAALGYGAFLASEFTAGPNVLRVLAPPDRAGRNGPALLDLPRDDGPRGGEDAALLRADPSRATAREGEVPWCSWLKR